MSQELVNFKGQSVAPSFRGVVDPQESLADGIGGGYGVIGYRGKEWTLRYRGETYRFLEGKHPAPFIDVIIVRQAPNKSKSYYPSYEEGDNGRPTCASIDGITPDEDVEDRQADACSICPRNVFKTKANGMRGKECADYKRIAVMLLPETSAAMLGSPLLEPVFLRVPAASLTNLGTYGQYLQKQGYPYIGLVTRVSFEPGKAYPKMQFLGESLLPEENAPFILPMREDPVSLRITGEDNSYRIKQIGQSAPQQQVQKPKVSNVSFASAAAEVAKKNGNGVDTVKMIEATAVEVLPVEAAPVQVKPAVPVQVDPAPGEAEESDADLDARLGSLIKF